MNAMKRITSKTFSYSYKQYEWMNAPHSQFIMDLSSTIRNTRAAQLHRCICTNNKILWAAILWIRMKMFERTHTQFPLLYLLNGMDGMIVLFCVQASRELLFVLFHCSRFERIIRSICASDSNCKLFAPAAPLLYTNRWTFWIIKMLGYSTCASLNRFQCFPAVSARIPKTNAHKDINKNAFFTYKISITYQLKINREKYVQINFNFHRFVASKCNIKRKQIPLW